MAFCEECGAELEPQARFCESCGAAVVNEECATKESHNPLPSDGAVMDVFCGPDWASRWMNAASSCGSADLGIIMTREATLAGQIAVSREKVHGVVASYIANMQKHGVRYYYLDLDNCPFYDGNGDVDSVVAALRSIVDVARPKYLFIIGNEEIVDVARWENQAGDDDEEVESDLCYATLDVNSPWKGQKYNINEVMRVGRFPTCAGESFEFFCCYFSNTSQCNGCFGEVVPYGLSALVWEEESNDEYRAISHDSVDVSPEVTKDTVGARLPSDANLLFFNLHGNNNTEVI